jgi:hypothetical protein
LPPTSIGWLEEEELAPWLAPPEDDVDDPDEYDVPLDPPLHATTKVASMTTTAVPFDFIARCVARPYPPGKAILHRKAIALGLRRARELPANATISGDDGT